MNEESRPQRRWLRHDIPANVPDPSPVFFLTICCSERGRNQLAFPRQWKLIHDSAAFYSSKGKWDCPLLLAMPDHLHLILSVPSPEDLSKNVGNWKRWLAKTSGIHWQKGFFDHRIRDQIAALEKSHYILQNPVRASLVSNPEDWPYRKVDESWLRKIGAEL